LLLVTGCTILDKTGFTVIDQLLNRPYTLEKAFNEMLDIDVKYGASFYTEALDVENVFSDGWTYYYDWERTIVSLDKIEEMKNIPSNDQFNVFPSLKALHTNYKKIDYDGKADELQTGYDDLDFSIIEGKYENRVKWLVPRFILFYFLIWSIPVFLGYFLFRMIGYYRSFGS